MTQERTTPLRQRMIEDHAYPWARRQARQAHIRTIKDFAGFLKRSPDTATPDDLRACLPRRGQFGEPSAHARQCDPG
ncbi:hypothetical protein [Rhizobium azibense]|uniref:hypothetical protein n=1 Tax=Rhizobium azibense TaxID=1136135 RepID=UPI001FE1A265|nr:hypothetical protein [Rhizobium azibense]